MRPFGGRIDISGIAICALLLAGCGGTRGASASPTATDRCAQANEAIRTESLGYNITPSPEDTAQKQENKRILHALALIITDNEECFAPDIVAQARESLKKAK